MYFLWKRTPHGSIRVSCGGLSGFIDRVLPGKSRCCGLTVAEGETASVTLVLSTDSSAPENDGIEEHIASVVTPMGFRTQVIWVDKNISGAEWNEKLPTVYQSPWTWMVIAGVLALMDMAGLKGIFWTFFWGATAWFVSKFFIFFLTRRKKMKFLLPATRR